MSDQSNFIAQIQEEEKNAENMLEKAESDNNKRVAMASDELLLIIGKAEEEAREKAIEKIKKSKEGAKEEFKKIIVDGDNSRRNIVEGGKVNLSKAIKHVNNAFVKMFN